MKYHGVHLRGAVVQPLACVVLLKVLQAPEVAPHLSRYLHGLGLRPDRAGHPTIAQVEAALAQMHAAQEEYWALMAEPDGSAVGTAEPALAEAQAESVPPPSGHLTVTAVAERLSFSREYVRRLCRSGRLSATRRGREWLIEPGSVIEYEAMRSTAA